MAEKGTKFIGAALTVAVAGCAPNVAPVVTGIEPVIRIRRAALDCPSLPGQPGNRQVILSGLTPGEKVIISNRNAESSRHYIGVQEGGEFSLSGQEPLQREPGEQLAASGYPEDRTTIYNVFAGEPEFSPTSNEMYWINAGSAITAFCIVPGLRSPYGYFAPVGNSSDPTVSQG